MTPQQLIPGQLIPTPPDFPVEWRDASESGTLWARDVMHFPYQNAPLFEFIIEKFLMPGLNHGAVKFDMPIRFKHKFFNTYYYSAVLPVLGPDGHPVQPPADEDPAKHPMVVAIMNLPDAWENQLLPEIKRIIARGESSDLPGATLAQLVTHLDDVIQDTARAWQIHFEVTHPMRSAMSFFDDFYQDLFGADTFGAYHLLQGFDNKSLEANRGLFALSRMARNMPVVLKILETQSSDKVMAALQASDTAQPFLQALDVWLREYGQRGDLFDSVTSVGWIEDPTPAIKNLKDYIKCTEDIDTHRQGMAAERERLLGEARAKLAPYPEPVRMQFEGLLRSAQVGNVLHEDHNYWIDQRATYQLRRVYLEVGRRLAASGSIGSARDVVFLYAEEARAALLALQQTPQNLQKLVVECKEIAQRFAMVQPPPMLGSAIAIMVLFNGASMVTSDMAATKRLSGVMRV